MKLGILDKSKKYSLNTIYGTSANTGSIIR